MLSIIILNEVEYAKGLLEGHVKNKNPYLYIPLLSRYYRQTLNYAPKKTVCLLTEFMKENYINYNPVKWSPFIDSCVKRAKKTSLSEIQSIGITEKELSIVQSARNNTIAKVMFTLLCIAKYFNTRKDTNNSWTNIASKDIFKMANVSTSIEKQDAVISELYQSNLVGMTNKVDNLNTRVLFVDTGTEYVMNISDFRNLGNEYMNWKYGGYFRCAECGALKRQNKNRTRIYCNECIGYSPIETKKIVCIDCRKEFIVDSLDTKTNRCPECYKKYISKINSEKYRILHPDEFKSVVCSDCGLAFEVLAKDNQTDRCPECYKKYRAEKNKEKYRRYNAKRRA